jgi:serine/threonine protein kinase
VRDACRALEYAHRRGFLHLDLHPDSLLIGDDYQIILDVNDWRGIGVRDGAGAAPFAIMGRPAYMSPEQVNGAGPGVGPATDVFGLGGILHVLLFGTPPNHRPGKTSVAEVIMAIAERAFDPRRPGKLRPQIVSRRDRRLAHELAGICLKSLASEPEDRYPSAAALGAALDGCVEESRSAWPPWHWPR